MTTHTITLDKIDFKDNSGRFDLQYPLYPSHIDYGKLADRDLVQIEPAFQFITASVDSFDFVLRIDPAVGAEFAADRMGRPIVREATNAIYNPPVTGIVLEDSNKSCRVTVEPENWTAGPHAIVLRIFCNRPGQPHLDTDGVSLTFVRPGGTAVTTVTGSAAGPSPVQVGISDFGFRGEAPVSTYDIFKTMGLPLPLSMEPAFRLSPGRSTVHLKLNLKPEGFRFRADAMNNVPLVARSSSGARPTQLSRVVALNDQKAITFSWNRGTGGPAKFGFYAPIEEFDPASNSFLERDDIFIDPILFHDPPSG